MLCPPRRSAVDPAGLLAEMDYCGISEALVTHAASVEESPVTGNDLVAQDAAAQPRLHPVWTITPPQTRELGTAAEFVAALRAAGVRALYAYPDLHQYLLNRETFGTLFELLLEHHVPVFVRRWDWEKLTALLREFPQLTLVQTAWGSWGWDHFARPLLEAYPNFYLETSEYQLAGGFEDHCRTYGPERLLFGTNYPYFYMRGPELTLRHADISDDDKAAIAGGNLRRLLGEVSW
jgi:predicted TIM-barrel fold metal-dependent hydrolase